MTLLYASDGERTITFRTNDNYLHAGDCKTGNPFHLFRMEKKDDFPEFAPAIVCRLLKFAISRYEDGKQTYTTDWPDIVGDYDKIEFEGIKMSCFDVLGYFVAATILTPGVTND